MFRVGFARSVRQRQFSRAAYIRDDKMMHRPNVRSFTMTATGLTRRGAIGSKIAVTTIAETDPVMHKRQDAEPAEAIATCSSTPGKGRRWRRPLRMTPKAQRRRWFKQHARRMRARVLHKMCETEEPPAET